LRSRTSDFRAALREPVPQLAAEALGHVLLDVHASTQGGQAGMRPGRRDALDGVQVGHGAVVRHDQPVEAHLLPQQGRDEPHGGRRRLTADGVVGGHHTAQAGHGDRRLEGLAVHLHQQTVRDVAMRAVDAALGVVGSDEVLRDRFSAAAGSVFPLDTMCVGSPERGGEGRVLAVALAVSPHTWIAGDVENRSQGVRDAEGPFLPTHDLADPALDLDVPARRAAQPRREARRTREVRAA
jgi:hypothetical protein